MLADELGDEEGKRNHDGRYQALLGSEFERHGRGWEFSVSLEGWVGVVGTGRACTEYCETRLGEEWNGRGIRGEGKRRRPE